MCLFFGSVCVGDGLEFIVICQCCHALRDMENTIPMFYFVAVSASVMTDLVTVH